MHPIHHSNWTSENPLLALLPKPQAPPNTWTDLQDSELEEDSDGLDFPVHSEGPDEEEMVD